MPHSPNANKPSIPSEDRPATAPALDCAQALRQAQAHGLERLEAQLLLLHLLGRAAHERAWLLAHGEAALSAEQARTWSGWVQRRAQGEPLAYITGSKAFYGLELQVDARVLDPRADTETLVDWALALPPPASHSSSPTVSAPPRRVIDLGTGSGAIALALKHQRPHWEVHAVDASADALAVAQRNAQRLALTLHLQRSDWLATVSGRFDLIVSNPPYIAAHDPHLAALQHEPQSALVSGADGLDDIRRLIAQAPAHLAPGGWLLLEHGYDQAAAVRACLQAAGFGAVQSRRDLAGIERCSGGQFLTA